MSTALENAVDALSDPKVAVGDSLRRLLVVSRRINAAELSSWLLGELSGFSISDEVPVYRSGAHLPLKLQFDGPMGSSTTMTLTRKELPSQLTRGMEVLAFREPVAELEALSQGKRDPELALPVRWVALYRHLVSEGRVPSVEMMVLNRAAVGMPRTHLTGILDRVKSTALDLALSLEDVSPEAGRAGGPTVISEPALAQQITLQMTHIYASQNSTVTLGDNATVAPGDGAVAMRVELGDVEGLLRAARQLLDTEAVAALAEALEADGEKPADATLTFLNRVKAGGYGLVGGLTSNGAYDGLVHLLQQAFPGTFPR